MNFLIVAAHPDDEILGAGATISDLIDANHNVNLCILSRQSSTRYDESLVDSMKKSHEIMGITHSFLGNYRCMCFKDEPHHEMVQFIENAMLETQPDIIITHHPADLHNDHYITSIICQEAAKLSQRQICEINPLKGLLYMEVQSSTDWCINTSWSRFTPNLFLPISEKALKKKIAALEVYHNVIRNAPHPRSIDAIRALSIFRGSQSGAQLAEAFEIGFMRGLA